MMTSPTTDDPRPFIGPQRPPTYGATATGAPRWSFANLKAAEERDAASSATTMGVAPRRDHGVDDDGASDMANADSTDDGLLDDDDHLHRADFGAYHGRGAALGTPRASSDSSPPPPWQADGDGDDDFDDRPMYSDAPASAGLESVHVEDHRGTGSVADGDSDDLGPAPHEIILDDASDVVVPAPMEEGAEEWGRHAKVD